MTMSDPESLDLLLYECTKSADRALDADSVEKFCSAIDRDLDGPSTAARLLGHKIQSPQPQESLNALCVTDECVRKCGGRFQSEIGKFRFLNEIIKMISPKYFGDKTSAQVKTKSIELLYKWSLDLRHEPKILDAYEMLKRQGIIEDDPVLGAGNTANGHVATEAFPVANEETGATVSSTDEQTDDKTNHSIFDDEDKSKLLAKLLRSKHPDDLQAANRLIKNMVKQDEEKQEKISQRYNLLETVRNNVKLLGEMLDCYQMAGGSSTSDKDIIRELYKNIDQERPKLFKLASDTEDKDSDGMSQILQVNDDVVQISQRYKQVIDQGAGGAAEKQKATAAPLSDDLAGLDLAGASTNSSELFSAFEGASAPSTQASNILALFSTVPAVTSPITPALSTAPPSFQATPPTFQAAAPPTLSATFPMVLSSATATTTATTSSNLDDLFTFNTTTAVTQPTESSNVNTVMTQAALSDDIGLLSLDSPATPSAGLAAPLLPANDAVSLFDTQDDTAENLFDSGNSKKSALEDLDFLGQDLLQKTKPTQQMVNPV